MSGYLIIGKTIIKEKIQLNNPMQYSEDDTTIKNEGTTIRLFDGSAANTAFNLGLLSQKPTLLTKIGEDIYDKFTAHCNKNSINLLSIPNSQGLTARKLIINDSEGKKIEIELLNSFKEFSIEEIDKFVSDEFLTTINSSYINTGSFDIDIAFINYIISKIKNVVLFYTLDNNRMDFSKWHLTQILRKVVILIVTPEVIKKMEKFLNKPMKSFFTEFKRLKYIIEVSDLTRIIIYGEDKEVKVSEGPALEIKDLTGWKDALIAGLIYGVNNKKPIIESTKLGSALASYAIEIEGCQTHSSSLEEVIIRSYEVKSISKD